MSKREMKNLNVSKAFLNIRTLRNRAVSLDEPPNQQRDRKTTNTLARRAVKTSKASATHVPTTHSRDSTQNVASISNTSTQKPSTSAAYQKKNVTPKTAHFTQAVPTKSCSVKLTNLTPKKIQAIQKDISTRSTARPNSSNKDNHANQISETLQLVRSMNQQTTENFGNLERHFEIHVSTMEKRTEKLEAVSQNAIEMLNKIQQLLGNLTITTSDMKVNHETHKLGEKGSSAEVKALKLHFF